MESNEILNNFENKCRACMLIPGSHSIFHLSEDRKWSLNISEMMTAISRTDIFQNDGLPDKICEICLVSLEKAYQFQKMCLDSYVKMKNILNYKSIKIEVMDTEIQYHDYNTHDYNISSKSEPVSTVKEENDQEQNTDEIDEKYSTEGLGNSLSIRNENCINDDDLINSEVLHEPQIYIQNVEKNDEKSSNIVVSTEIKSEKNFDLSDLEEEENQKVDSGNNSGLGDEKSINSDEVDAIHSDTQYTENIKTEYKHKCVVCNKKFNRRFNLDRHLKTHSKNSNTRITDYKCAICEKYYKSEGHLDLHRILYHSKSATNEEIDKKPSYFRCLECNKEFKEQSFIFHMRIHSKKKFTCSICGKEFKKLASLTKHKHSHENGNQSQSNNTNYFYKCDVCKKKFSKKFGFDRHIKIHDPEGRPYECSICKCYYANRSHLLRHNAALHNKENPTNLADDGVNILSFKCLECNKEFDKQQGLASHMKAHSDKKFICCICRTEFTMLYLLKEHVEQSHGNNDDQMKCNKCERTLTSSTEIIDHIKEHDSLKQIKCDICNKGYPNLSRLQNHKRLHTDERPFTCTKCEKTFRNPCTYREHVLRHSEIKPFQCPECGKKFALKYDLRSHMTTHLKIKPFSCDVCGSSFTHCSTLSKHKLIHSGEKPYACTHDDCDKKFNSAFLLSRHMKIHTGEKPHVCKFCNRGFVRKSDMINHMKRHTGDKIYQCNQCPEAFKLKVELKEHIVDHFKQSQKQNSDNI